MTRTEHANRTAPSEEVEEVMRLVADLIVCIQRKAPPELRRDPEYGQCIAAFARYFRCCHGKEFQ